MGQYWLPVNLDKKEFVDPHKLGTGLKLWEQLANHPGTGAALIILCAAMPQCRGGGDLHLEEDEPFVKDLKEAAGAAKQIIGRWAGDRIAIVGDYAEDSDLPAKFHASQIHEQCRDGGEYVDITNDVCAIIEYELNGKFQGDGWREFVRKEVK